MTADRNVLLGVLALQLSFVTREQVIEAVKLWGLDKTKGLGEILELIGATSRDQRELLEALMEKMIESNHGSIQRSLEHLSSVDSEVTALLCTIMDNDVDATLQFLNKDQLSEVSPYQSGKSSRKSDSRFRVIRLHAKGGLGEVYVAQDTELEREVALKEIQGRFSDDAETRDRFRREAEITGNLEHPGIVPVYGLGQYADGRPYYAMRFIRGESLKEAIDSFHVKHKANKLVGGAGLELRQLLRRLVDVCNAIAYAHSRGVLHRDLKPGNIVLGKYGETLVVDWGLAKPNGDTGSHDASVGPVSLSSGSGSALTEIGSVVGTPAYMSPEQASGKLEQLTGATDVYSLGATLFHLITGEYPIIGKSPNEVVKKVISGEIRRPRDVNISVPKALEAICLKAMANSPAERYASPISLAEDIEKWLADEPVSAYFEPWSIRARRWLRRHPAIVSSASACVAIGLVAVTFVAYLKSAHALELAQKNEELLLAKERAEEREQDAITAVNRFGDAVSSNKELKNNPSLENLRKELLREPLTFFKSLRERLKSDDIKQADFRQRLASAAHNLGRLSSEIGNIDEALIANQEALKIRTDLVQNYPSIPEYQNELAKSHNNLGIVLIALGKRDEALKAYEQARVIREKLMMEHPSVMDYKSSVAASYNNLANLFSNTGRMQEALAAIEKASKIYEQLVNDYPNMDEHQSLLAKSLHNRGNFYTELHRTAEARTSFESALKLHELIVENNPTAANYRSDFAHSYFAFGILLRSISRIDEARVVFDRALNLREQLVEEHPTVKEFQADLARSFIIQGELLKSENEQAGALSAFESALNIREKLVRDNPLIPEYKTELGLAYQSLGGVYAKSKNVSKAQSAYEQSIRIQEQLVREHPAEPGYLANLADGYFSVGQLFSDIGNLESSKLAHEKAAAIYEELVQKDPTVSRFRNNLGESYYTSSILYRKLGKLEEARTYYDKTIKIQEELASENPTVPGYQSTLANTFYGLGLLLKNMERYEDAEAAYVRAIKIQEGLANDSQTGANYRTDLVNSYHALSILLTSRNKLVEAQVAYERQLQIQKLLVDSNPSSTVHRFELVQILKQFASFLEDRGMASESQNAFDQAISVLTQLTTEHPGSQEYRYELGKTFDRLGFLLEDTGNVVAAKIAYQKAIEVLRQLADESPSEAVYRSYLGNVYYGLGLLLDNNQEQSFAQDAYREAVKLQEHLILENPTVQKYQDKLSDSLYGLGLSLQASGKVEEALLAFDKVKQICEELVRNNPSEIRFQRKLADHYVNIAIKTRDAGRDAKAILLLKEGLKTYELLLQEDSPSKEDLLSNVASCFYELGHLRYRNNELNKAKEDWEQSVKCYAELLRDNSSNIAFQRALGYASNNLAVVHLDSKNYAEASKILEDTIRDDGYLSRRHIQDSGHRSLLTLLFSSQLRLANETDDANLALTLEDCLIELASGDPVYHEIDARYLRVRKGELKVESDELLIFGQRMYDLRQFTQSVWCYEEALKVSPDLPLHTRRRFRYDAACSAALAAQGRSRTDERLADEDTVRLRGLALEWLKSEYAFWLGEMESTERDSRLLIASTINHWLNDYDLQSIRTDDMLQKLPGGERKEWQDFWQVVRELKTKAEGQH